MDTTVKWYCMTKVLNFVLELLPWCSPALTKKQSLIILCCHLCNSHKSRDIFLVIPYLLL